jgi:hypothetical protein
MLKLMEDKLMLYFHLCQYIMMDKLQDLVMQALHIVYKFLQVQAQLS